MAGSSASQPTTQTTEVDAETKAFRGHMWGKAKELYNRPFQQYSQDRYAGFDPSQTAAQNRMLGFANQTPGYYGQSMDAVRQNLGFGGGYNAPQMQAATQQEIESGVGARMNPYTSQVIDRTMGDYNRARQMTRDATGAEAMGGGAFGGSRHGVADALTNEAFARQSGNMAAQLRHQGYGQALSGFEGERARLQQMQLQSAGMSADDAARTVQMRGAAANQLSALGGLQSQEAVQRMGLEEAVGGQRQALDQQRKDFAYQQFIEQQNHPYRQFNVLQGAMGAPTGETTTGTLYRNPNAGMLGGAGTGAAVGFQVGGGPVGAGIGAVLGGYYGSQGY